jgi:hypothetical protein
MCNIIHRLRIKRNLPFRCFILSFWIITASHALVLPTVTLSDDRDSRDMAIHSVNKPASTFLSLLLEWAFNSSNSSTDFADLQDDSVEKMDFISTHYPAFLPKQYINLDHERISFEYPKAPSLKKNTPPPKLIG